MCLRPFALICGSLVLCSQDNPKALYERGRTYSELSRGAFEQLLRIAPESGYVLALVGEVKAKERRYSAALYAFDEAAKRMPRLRGVHSGMAGVYAALGKAAEAEAAETAEQKMGSPDCAVEKLHCAFSGGRFEDVVKSAKLKKNAEGYYWLARAYNEMAIQSFAELGHLPESPELHEVKAELFRQQGKFREAVEEWRAVVRVAPGNRAAQHELATSLYLTQDYKRTLRELQQFLEAEPDSANLNFFVGDSLLQTEQVEQAVPYLEKALKLDARVLPAHASLGLCYGRLGEPRRAIPHLKAALELDNDGSLHYQLARAYQSTGQPALAKIMLDRYEKLHKSAAATANAPAP